MIRAALFTIALLFCTGQSLRAEPAELPISDVARESRDLLQSSNSSAANEPAPTTDGAPIPFSTDLANDPDWDQPPHGSPHWKLDLAYVPTTIFNDRDDIGHAFRLNLAEEEWDGYGRRGRLWIYEQDFGRTNLFATTFNYDFYRHVHFERGELLFETGPMLAILRDDFNNHRIGDRFYGGGWGVGAEGFYPWLRYERTDIGPIGYARLSGLLGLWDNNDSFEIGRDSIAIVDEFAWGLELRRRIGRRQNNYFYIDVTREIQDWGSADIPYVSSRNFQGTAINLGLEW